MREFNYQQEFQLLCQQLGCQNSDWVQVFNELRFKYGQSNRHYHTLLHIKKCLVTARGVAGLAECYPSLLMALWFHDIEPEVQDSVESMRQQLTLLKIEPAKLELIAKNILATNHPVCPRDNDAQLTHDIDLIGLADKWSDFREAGSRLRLEYGRLSTTKFYQQQLKFLRRLSSRPIYSHACFKVFESLAKDNVERRIAELEAALTFNYVAF